MPFLAPACAPAENDAPRAAVPQGVARQDVLQPRVVLEVGGLPVQAEEVDEVAAWIAQIQPENTRAHHRRLALTNYVLPGFAVRSRYPEARGRALEVLQAGVEKAFDPAAGGLREEITGDWKRLGLDVWARARTLEPGSWSEPFERVGHFARVRLEEAPVPAETTAAQTLRVTVAVLPYDTEEPLDEAAVEGAIDSARLEIVDPAWGRLVPESWKYRMR